jgi:HlyD family secretion protein
MSQPPVPQGIDDYDDLLDMTDHPWRKRLVGLAVLLVLAVAGVYALWSTVLSGDGSSEAAIQTATVQRGSIVNSVSTSGTAVAQSTANLSFSQSGRITAVNVTVGQEVKQGDVLAEVESDTLQDSLTKAQVNLASAQNNLSQLLEGSSAAELASADQSVIQAQANYEKAQTALQDLLDGTDAAEVDSAQQSVLSAESQLAKARSARTDLNSTWEDAVAAAEEAVDRAEGAVDKAERAADNAAADYEDCQASPPASDPTCRDALANKEDAADAVDAAEDDLDAAEGDLDELGDGPSSDDIASADMAIASAELALKMANDKLTELNQGPSQDDVTQAQHDGDSAAAALTAAQAKRNDTYQGADTEEIQAQRNQVLLAQLAVNQAQKDLEKAKLIAPFEGTVAALNIAVGEEAGSGSSSTAAIVLNTPNAIILKLSVGESDLPNLKTGQNGTATFDAISGQVFPVVVDSVGTNPTTTQGVVTYEVRAHIISGMSMLSGSQSTGLPGSRASRGGQISATPAATGTPAAVTGTPAAGPTPGSALPQAQALAPAAVDATVTNPIPGMNASVTIIVDQRQDVLTVLSTAVQSEGRESFVEVQKEGGSTERVVVETGLSDSTNTEITSGLEEGQTVIIPTVTATTSGQSQPTQGGKIIDFFTGPGGPPGESQKWSAFKV